MKRHMHLNSIRVAKLTDQQKLMVSNYLANGFKKKKAMLDAGYAEGSAVAPERIFGKPTVQAEVARQQSEILKRNELDADWVISRLKDRADSGNLLAKFKRVDDDGQLYWDFTEATQLELSLVQAVGVEFGRSGRGEGAIDITRSKVELPDAHAALMALARHLGLFDDKVTVQGALADSIAEGRAYARKANAPEGDVDSVHALKRS
jgi:phage terminase small subunit